MNRKKIVIWSMFMGAIFVFVLMFFTQIHPIIIFDTDDWCYAYIHRSALPLWKAWNPIRIFPEVFMPLVSMIGVYAFAPLTGDYFGALTLSYALSLAIAFTMLIYMLGRNFKTYPFWLILFFIICHFWILRTTQNGNYYMLSTIDACTYFFYVIPNLLNCIVVSWWMRGGGGYFSHLSRKLRAVFLFLVYLSIFSNLWAGIITASYVGSILLIDIVITLKQRTWKLKIYCRDHFPELAVIFIWLLSHIYEVNGGRAAFISSGSYMDSLRLALNVFKGIFGSLNPVFALSSTLIILAGIVLTVKNKQWKRLKILVVTFISFLLMACYLILSCAKAGSHYLSRPDVFYGCFFFCMIIILHCAHQIFDSVPRIRPVIPLLLFIAFVDCNTSGRTFRESNCLQLPPQICLDISNDIKQQFLDAEASGAGEIVLYVPFFEGEGNWPLSISEADHLSSHLYKMGIIKKQIKVIEMIPTREKNSVFHIN